MPTYASYGQRAYPDIIRASQDSFDEGRRISARRYADNRARSGDYHGAADELAILAPEESRSYRDQGQRRSNVEMTRALGGGDFNRANSIASETGDVGQLSAVQTLRQAHDVQQRTEAWRVMQRYKGDWQNVSQMQGEEQQAAYREFMARARRESADSPELTQFLAQFPEQYNPRVGGIIENALATAMSNLLDPEDIARIEREGRQLDVQERNADTQERRADAAEMTANAAMLRAERGGNGDGQQSFNRADKLRDEYNQQTQSFRTVADIARRSEEYVRRIGTNPRAASGQGDVGLVYALAKIYDPTSVVREGEFATMARQGGYGEQMRSWVLQALGSGFSPTIRAQVMAEIRNGVRAQQAQRDQTRTRYTDLANRAGIDPSMVIDDYQAGAAATPPARPRSVPQDYVWNPTDQTWDPPN